MSGYLYFHGESDVVSEVAERLNSAGSAYHHTEYWSDADDGEKSHSDMIQDALNSADARIATLEAENAALRKDAERFAWVLPLITGEDDADTNARTLRLGQALVSGLTGIAAIDAARKEASNGNS